MSGDDKTRARKQDMKIGHDNSKAQCQMVEAFTRDGGLAAYPVHNNWIEEAGNNTCDSHKPHEARAPCNSAPENCGCVCGKGVVVKEPEVVLWLGICQEELGAAHDTAHVVTRTKGVAYGKKCQAAEAHVHNVFHKNILSVTRSR